MEFAVSEKARKKIFDLDKQCYREADANAVILRSSD